MVIKRYCVEKEKIAANIRILQARMGSRRLWAVLKADGYGLGVAPMAQICAENGVRHFAVTDLESVEALRSADIQAQEILFMASADLDEIPRLSELGVTFMVASQQDAQNLKDFQVKAHIKVDTGMGRRGFQAKDTQQIASLYARYPNIHFTGIYTHFSNGADPKVTRQQFHRFQSVLKALEQMGIDPGLRHCCASTSVFGPEEMLLDGARIGSALLGRVPARVHREGTLVRTGVCEVSIETVRNLPKGSTVGYGGLYYASKDSVLALCPIGGHHGLGTSMQAGVQRPRQLLFGVLRYIRQHFLLRSVPTASVHGKICKVVGGICSEAVMLDVTGVDCKAGDIAVFDINPLHLHDVPIEFV